MNGPNYNYIWITYLKGTLRALRVLKSLNDPIR